MSNLIVIMASELEGGSARRQGGGDEGKEGAALLVVRCGSGGRVVVTWCK